jgi:hypothetical protein
VTRPPQISRKKNVENRHPLPELLRFRLHQPERRLDRGGERIAVLRVKQKPMISRSPFTETVGDEMTACDRMRP